MNENGQWEYRVVIDDVRQDKHDDAGAVGELLKTFGELGWELASVVRDGLRRELYFKRPKSLYQYKRPSVDPETARGGK